MNKNALQFNVYYTVRVYRDEKYLGSTSMRRVGAQNIETHSTRIHEEVLDELLAAVGVAANSFEFMRIKPQLGELIQRSIWDFLTEQQKSDSSADAELPPF